MDKPPPVSIDLSKYISIAGDKPAVRRTGLPVSTVAYRARACSYSLEQLVYELNLEEAEVLSALLYYESHRDKIDEQEGDYELYFEAKD